MDLTLKQVRWVKAIHDSPTFRAAADSVNVSPPALTKMVRQLEDDLGVEIVDRQTRHLTVFGEAILKNGMKAVSALTGAVEMVEALKEVTRREVFIGTTLMLSNVLASCVAESVNRDPESHYRVITADPKVLTHIFNKGEADVLFNYGEESDDLRGDYEIESWPFPDIEYFCSIDHPLAGREIELKQILDYPMVGYRPPVWWENWFRSYANCADMELPDSYGQISPYHRVTTNNVLIALELMLNANAIAQGMRRTHDTFPGKEHFARLNIIDLPPIPRGKTVFLAHRANLADGAQEFADLARKTINALVETGNCSALHSLDES